MWSSTLFLAFASDGYNLQYKKNNQLQGTKICIIHQTIS